VVKSVSANAAPRGLPSVAPIPMIGNRRSPVGLSNRSLPYDQNCATTALLKIPTQMKNARPIYGTFAQMPKRNNSTLRMKNAVMPSNNRIRSTREANHP
jgi:hypothetical protein